MTGPAREPDGLGQACPPAIDDDRFVYVLGDSHVRSFAADPSFVPLFVGAGRQNCFITDRHAEDARDRILKNFRRLDEGRPVMLVFGEPDIRFYLEDQFEARTLGGPDANAYVAGCAERFLGTVGPLSESFDNRILVYNVVPNTRAAHNELAAQYNDLLRQRLPALGVEFVDLWTVTFDSANGLVEPKFSADEIHLNHRIVPFARQFLLQRGIALGSASHQPYAWSYFYRIDIDDRDNTRIWGDARLDSRSAEYADSEIARAAARRLAEALAQDQADSILVANCREGFVPLALPPRPTGSIIAIDDDPEKIRAAHRLVRFAARDDIFAVRRDLGEVGTHDVIVDFAVLKGDPSDVEARVPRLAAACNMTIYLLGQSARAEEILASAGFSHIAKHQISVTTKSGRHQDELLVAKRLCQPVAVRSSDDR